MPISLAAVRAAIEAKASKKGSKTPSAYFPFYQTPIGGTSVLRLLPDGNIDNPLPWATKFQFKMPFCGVSGGDYETGGDVLVTILSEKTFGKKDSVAEAMKELWDGTDAEKNLARIYYPKPTYICQALVVSTPVVETAAPECPIRLVGLNKSIADIVQTALTDVDAEWAPHDIEHGRDFKIVVGQNGNFRSYNKSGFSIKERPLNATELAAIEKWGLRDLKAELGAAPGEEQVAMLEEMLQASLNQEPFDVAKWGAYYKAWPADGTTPAKPIGGSKRAATPASSQTTAAIMNAVRSRNTSTTEAAAN